MTTGIHAHSNYTFILIAFILATNVQVLSGQLNVKTYRLNSPAKNLFWNNETKTLTVVTSKEEVYLDLELKVIGPSSTAPGCPISNVNCPRRPFYGTIAALDDSGKRIVDCGNEQKIFCKKNGHSTDHSKWMILDPKHTSESKCLKAETVEHSRNSFKNQCKVSIPRLSLEENNSAGSEYFIILTNTPDNIYFAAKSNNAFYIYSFILDSLVYIVFTERTTDYQFSTRIVRFCANAENSISYTAVTIVCEDDLKNVYGKALSAYYMNRTMNEHYNEVPENRTLFVTFASSDQNGDQRSPYQSVTCMFPLSEIESSFENLSHVPTCEHTVGEKNGASDNDEPDKDVHSEHRCNDVLKGTLKIVLQEKGTSLALAVKIPGILALVGTADGNVLQFLLRKEHVSQTVFNESLLNYVYDHDQKKYPTEILRSNDLANKYRNVFVLIGNTVVRYPVCSCIAHPTSKSCLHTQVTVPCGWCNTVCTIREHCKDKFQATWTEYRGRIEVSLVSPFSGPIQGGTVLKLNVVYSFCDTHPKEEQAEFHLGGVQCKTSNWTDLGKTGSLSWSVECVTGSQLEEKTHNVTMFGIGEHGNGTKGRILANVSTTLSFSFVVPEIHGIKPGYGPTSGGTNVTIFGKHLDSGSDIGVSVAGLNCTYLKVHEGNVVCTTKASNKIIRGNFMVWIDGTLIKTKYNGSKGYSEYFQYETNPYVSDIYPTSAIFSGETSMTVRGKNLESVEKPKILVEIQIEEQTWTFVEKCHHHQQTVQCRIPSLAVDARIPQPTATEPLKTNFTLLFDGVPKDVLYHKREDMPRLLVYYPDPTFDVVEDIIREENLRNNLTFKGYNLDVPLPPEDFKITINDTEFCTVSNRYYGELHCVVNKTAILQLKQCKLNILPIRVKIGRRIYFLGNIQLRATREKPYYIPDWVYVSYGPFCGLVLVVIYARIKKVLKKCKKNEYESVSQEMKKDDERNTSL